MIILPDQQRSPAWVAARLGLPTSSRFDRLIGDGTKRSRDKIDRFLRDLATEWLLQTPVDAAASGFMDRGTNQEHEGRALYEFRTDVDVQEVGLILTDDRRAGASVDGLVGDAGILEIKTPSAVQHVAYLLENALLVADYRTQVDAQMLITERKWVDVISYNPDMPPLIVRVERDEELCDQLREALDDFCDRLAAMKKRLLDLGVKPRQTAQDGAGGTQQAKPDLPPAPVDPGPSRHERATELAAAWRALPDGEVKDSIRLAYMLTDGDDMARSIATLTDRMIAELTTDLGTEKL